MQILAGRANREPKLLWLCLCLWLNHDKGASLVSAPKWPIVLGVSRRLVCAQMKPPPPIGRHSKDIDAV